jgi:hypothetical protein
MKKLKAHVGSPWKNVFSTIEAHLSTFVNFMNGTVQMRSLAMLGEI